jgi:hypothetical protein
MRFRLIHGVLLYAACLATFLGAKAYSNRDLSSGPATFKKDDPKADDLLPESRDDRRVVLSEDGVESIVGIGPLDESTNHIYFFSRVPNDDGTFTQTIYDVGNGNINEFVVADLDGDGDLDARVEAKRGCGNTLYRRDLTNQGDGTFEKGDWRSPD